MTSPVAPADLTPESTTVFGRIRARIIGGLFLALPIVITFWILYWIYATFRYYILDPIVDLLRSMVSADRLDALPAWWDDYVAPIFAGLLALLTLYLLGLLVRSRWYRMLDWLLLHVPVVTTVYQAVSNVFGALERQRQGNQFKRVVLVAFPQPEMRSLGVVTNSLQDSQTGRTILCVCVLTGVMPPSGFTLFVPEEHVTDLPWSMNQMIQAVVSGGITLPATIPYYGPGPDASPETSPTGAG